MGIRTSIRALFFGVFACVLGMLSACKSGEKEAGNRQEETVAEKETSDIKRVSPTTEVEAEKKSEFPSLPRAATYQLAKWAVLVRAEVTAFERQKEKLDGTLLVGPSGIVRAIRSGGKWSDVEGIVESSAEKILAVELDLSGGKSSAQLMCRVMPLIPGSGTKYNILAATTFELERQGNGSLEERLAAVEAIAMKGSESSFSSNSKLEWNGNATKIWLRIFSDRNPETPVIDEVIAMDYHDSFTARWHKQPSPLISIPE